MRLLLGLVRLPVKLTLDLAGRALSVVAPSAPESVSPPPPPAPAPRTTRPATRAAAPPRNGGAPAARPPVAREPEPEHVSEEPVLVAEVAERGAEEGAGAEIHVDPPWEGYDDMTAAQIKARVGTEDPTVAAAVSLYEAFRKGRSSVLEAAARRTA